MFKRIIKAVKRAYDYFFKEDVVKIEYNSIVRPFIRPVAPAPIPAPVVAVAPVYKEAAAAIVPARDLKKEYKEWAQNMREYDMIRQKIAR
jgi:hypothetical protein